MSALDHHFNNVCCCASKHSKLHVQVQMNSNLVIVTPHACTGGRQAGHCFASSLPRIVEFAELQQWSLLLLHCRGTLKGSTMVHDEEAEISIRLATLIANSQRSHSATGQLPNPEAMADTNGELTGGQHASPQAADAGKSLLHLLCLLQRCCHRNTAERLPLRPAFLSKPTTSQVLPALFPSALCSNFPPLPPQSIVPYSAAACVDVWDAHSNDVSQSHAMLCLQVSL